MRMMRPRAVAGWQWESNNSLEGMITFHQGDN